jgi:hypothetical protein
MGTLGSFHWNKSRPYSLQLVSMEQQILAINLSFQERLRQAETDRDKYCSLYEEALEKLSERDGTIEELRALIKQKDGEIEALKCG